MVYPLFEFVLFWSIRKLSRFRVCYLDGLIFKRVKTLTVYVELYSGPEFLIHYKHSIILNSIWVTMLLGPGFPILFPISLMSMIILYMIEKLMLAYSYRKPPMYD